MKSKIIYFFLLLIILSKAYIFASKYIADINPQEYIVFIESLKEITKDKVSYNVRIGKNFKDKCILNIYKDKYSKEEKEKELKEFVSFKYADVIKLSGKFSKAELLNNPGEFNYRLYLYSKNIHGTINMYTRENMTYVEYTKTNWDKFLIKVDNFKQAIDRRIKANIESNDAEIAKALIYGDMENLEDKTKDAFQNIGVSHLMSVSGSHMASLMLIANCILRKKKQEKIQFKIIKNIILIILIITYCIFCSFGVSVVRSSVMLITNIFTDIFVKNNIEKKDKYLSLKISFFCILINSPFAIFNIGTQFSFLSVLGIMLFKEYITNNLKEKTKYHNLKKFKKCIGWILDNVSLCFSVQLLIFPIQLLSFNKINFPIILPNLIIGAVSNVIRILGSIGVIFVHSNLISSYIFSILNPIIKIVMAIVKIFNRLSFSITTKTLPPIFFVIYYFTVVFLYIFFRLKYILKDKDKVKMKYNLFRVKQYIKRIIIFSIVILSMMFIGINLYSKHFSKSVYFFNVKQGDMSYIKYKGESVLVDIGSMSDNLAFNVLSNFLKHENISSIDLVILSHMHKDHINGFEKLVQNYEVKKVIYSLPKQETENFKDFKRILKENNIQAQVVSSGHKIYLENISIQILFPVKKDLIEEDQDNANSLVCKIMARNTSLLYMGDANKESEEKILKGKEKIGNVDILKVGHHGSKTATSDNFLYEISPEYAVISAFKKYYGHPHQYTLDLLKIYNVQTFLTEKKGCIKFNLN